MAIAKGAATSPREALSLWWSDYEAHLAKKGTESERKRQILALPRLIVSPSLRMVMLIRVANASPRWTWFIWRNMFVHWFSSDWSGALDIGPGLDIPHPIGICIVTGATVGRDVTLGHNVTLGGDIENRVPVLEDRVYIFPGSLIIGGVRIGHDSIVGANCLVTRDVPPEKIFTPRGVLPRAASPEFRKRPAR